MDLVPRSHGTLLFISSKMDTNAFSRVFYTDGYEILAGVLFLCMSAMAFSTSLFVQFGANMCPNR